MKFIKYLFLLGAIFMISSDYYPVSEYVPILMDRDVMEKAVRIEQPRPMFEPGKIYYKSPYLFIVEKFKGVHIINNINPANPEKIGFLHVDGIRDIAIKDNVMYADNAVDLIAIQLNSTLNTASVTKRFKGYFPEIISPDGWGLSHDVIANRPKNTVIVGWKKK